MRTIHSSKALEEIGCSRSTLARLCVKHGIGEFIGQDRFFDAKEVARLKKLFTGKVGWPKGRKRK